MPQITESTGDIFSAPQNSVLIHACNCRGVWGSGVALEFKQRYPQAFEVYKEECNTPPSEFHQKSLLGTTLLIPPQEEDLATTADEGHWIACLFTSVDYGKKISSQFVILESTKKAMADLQKKMKFWKAKGQEFGDLWAVRINSGKFGVPWDRTKRILEQCGLDVKVVSPADDNVEEVEESKKRGRGNLDSKRSEVVTEERSRLENADQGTVKENASGDTTTSSKKRKERKPEPDLHEPNSKEEILEDTVRSSKKRKGKKVDLDHTKPQSKRKEKKRSA